ncbi:bacterial regulatory helix-turn-helix protein, AraC family protein [Asticcacaulis biprosthecium C19]|uniref:Bacterial regulatory helix-turn-helix protein, AraC family protein n=1 Tax=Asticcacaulis biprosthecium C19 TaxID=715226 RepID=F4QKB8_9CAUL|nr:AraC family transcriptional regulator [Asticcacaulis biprosthecium]EGF93296.1 bacterial regulatory helix-turn-helix protein, AraC family protein [Asticcacaulis biprosthecium C19]
MNTTLFWPALQAVRRRRPRDIHLYFALFAGSIVLFCLRSLMGGAGGMAVDFVAIAGCATCGWSWLLTRALFRREAPDALPWPLCLVLTMIVLTAVLRWSPVGPVQQMGGNVMELIGSTALLLALVEPLLGLRRGMAPEERRFRLMFSAAYATIMGIGVIWISGAPQGTWAAQWSDQVKVACALVGLFGAGLAVWYRGRNPLSDGARPRRVATEGDRVLGERVLRLMTEDRLYAEPSLKVADLARRMGEAEYRVTQCITGALGFANFNQMVNQFRIEQAQQMLSDPGYDHLPVLTIALDCGFGSIGPFNRAFKAQFEVTPTAFRSGRKL